MSGLNSTGGNGGNFNHVVGPIVGEKILINPTLKQLQDYGAKWKTQEPVYNGLNQQGEPQYFVDIYFKIEPFTYKDKEICQDAEIRNLRFYLAPKTKVAQSGKTQFVNKLGKFCYADNKEALSGYAWFSQDGLREALDGEDSIYGWLKEYGNFRNTDQMQLNRDLISKGDFSELIDFASASPERKFKCVLGLSFNDEKNRFNSVVYTKKFWRNWQEEISFSDGAGGWTNEPFSTGLPKILAQEYMDFNKSVLTPGTPMIISNAEAQNMADLPDKHEEINEATGNAPEVEGEDLPF